MRNLVLLIAVACSSSKKSSSEATTPPASTSTPTPTSTSPPVEAITLDRVIAPGATAVTRFSAAHVPARAPCSTNKAITAAYQIELDRTTYFVFEGPREAIATCVKPPAVVEWRGQFAIVGDRAQVDAALTADAASTRWHAIATAYPNASIWAARQDALVTKLFGVETASYIVVFDRLDKDDFEARAILTFRNAGDAAVAARRIKQAELHTKLDAPHGLVTSFRRMKVTQHSTTVEARFDLATFGGLGLGELQAQLAKLTN